jgi:hypothetical protein
MDRIRPLFGALVKKPAEPENISQMMKFSRYIRYKPFILGEPKDNYSDIGAGFIFNTVPQACVLNLRIAQTPEGTKICRIC